MDVPFLKLKQISLRNQLKQAEEDFHTSSSLLISNEELSSVLTPTDKTDNPTSELVLQSSAQLFTPTISKYNTYLREFCKRNNISNINEISNSTVNIVSSNSSTSSISKVDGSNNNGSVNSKLETPIESKDDRRRRRKEAQREKEKANTESDAIQLSSTNTSTPTLLLSHSSTTSPSTTGSHKENSEDQSSSTRRSKKEKSKSKKHKHKEKGSSESDSPSHVSPVVEKSNRSKKAYETVSEITDEGMKSNKINTSQNISPLKVTVTTSTSKQSDSIDDFIPNKVNDNSRGGDLEGFLEASDTEEQKLVENRRRIEACMISKGSRSDSDSDTSPQKSSLTTSRIKKKSVTGSSNENGKQQSSESRSSVSSLVRIKKLKSKTVSDANTSGKEQTVEQMDL